MRVPDIPSPALDTSSSMDALLEQPVFSVGLHQYVWDDAILAARLGGDWAHLERELGEGLACVKRMEKMEEDLDGEELRIAANEFRYAHDLVSAQEAENWLNSWGLTVEDWVEYLRRFLLRRKWAAQLRQTIECFPITREEMHANLRAEAVCSDRLASFAKRLAGRAAAHAKAVEAGWVKSEDDHKDRAGRVRALETGYRRFCEHVVDVRALRSQIDARRLDWIRFNCRYGSFPDEQVAREASLCLREDGADLDAIAARTGCALAETSLYLNEIEGAMRDRFLSAEPGAFIGPVVWRGTSVIFFIAEKVLPTIDNIEIKKRAETLVLDMALNREINKRVRWHARL